MIWKNNVSQVGKRRLIRKSTQQNVINISRVGNDGVEKLIYFRKLNEWWGYISNEHSVKIFPRLKLSKVAKIWKYYESGDIVEAGEPDEINILKLELGVINKIML